MRDFIVSTFLYLIGFAQNNGLIYAVANVKISCFLWLSKILFYVYITFALSIHPSMDT